MISMSLTVNAGNPINVAMSTAGLPPLPSRSKRSTPVFVAYTNSGVPAGAIAVLPVAFDTKLPGDKAPGTNPPKHSQGKGEVPVPIHQKFLFG